MRCRFSYPPRDAMPDFALLPRNTCEFNPDTTVPMIEGATSRLSARERRESATSCRESLSSLCMSAKPEWMESSAPLGEPKP
jgi:hypothetical protein